MPLAAVRIPDSLELPAQFLSNECLLFNFLYLTHFTRFLPPPPPLNFLRTAQGLFREARAVIQIFISPGSLRVRTEHPKFPSGAHKNSRVVGMSILPRHIDVFRSITYTRSGLSIYPFFFPLPVSFALSQSTTVLFR